MKKTKTSSAALILAALLLSSCAGEIAGGTAAAPAPDTTAAPAEKQTSADTAPTETTPVETTTAASSDTAGSASSPAESEKPSAAELLTPGVWWATSAFEEDCYYTFGEDGSGSLIFQDMGTGVGMDYAPEGSSCTFHLGSADNVTTAGVEADGDGIILRWEDGRVEYLTYMGAEEDFSFYSSTDLAEMAKWYCRDNNGGYEPSEADTSIDGSGLISIHLFDIADGHTATEAWYYIDRFTARGEDMNGEPVDLAPYGQTYDGDGVIAAHGGTQGSAPFEKLRKEISDAGALFGVKYLGYIAPEANDPEVFGSYIDHILSYTGALEVCGLDDGYMLSYYDFISTDAGQELYIVIPRETDLALSVSSQYLDPETAVLRESGSLYLGDSSPILLKCNASEIYSDVLLRFTDRDGGTVEWSPGISGENGGVLTYHPDGIIKDFTDYDSLATVELAPEG